MVYTTTLRTGSSGVRFPGGNESFFLPIGGSGYLPLLGNYTATSGADINVVLVSRVQLYSYLVPWSRGCRGLDQECRLAEQNDEGIKEALAPCLS
jgi:hypothetical protein